MTEREKMLAKTRQLAKQARHLRDNLRRLKCFEDVADEMTTAIRHLMVAVAYLTSVEESER